MFEKYTNVYSTLDLEKFFAAKNILSEHKIAYKDTSTNNQLRLSSNNLRGDNYLLSRDGFAKNTYSLSVKKGDEQTAKLLLERL